MTHQANAAYVNHVQSSSAAEKAFLDDESSAAKARRIADSAIESTLLMTESVRYSESVGSISGNVTESQVSFAQKAIAGANALKDKSIAEATARNAFESSSANAENAEELAQSDAQEDAEIASAEQAAAADNATADAALSDAQRASNEAINAASRGSDDIETQLPELESIPSDWQDMPVAASLAAFSIGVAADGWFTTNGTSFTASVTNASIYSTFTYGGDLRPRDSNGNLLTGWQLTISPMGNGSGYGAQYNTYLPGIGEATALNGRMVTPGLNNLNSSPGDGTRVSGDQLRSHLSRSYASADSPAQLTPAFDPDGHAGDVRFYYEAPGSQSNTGYVSPLADFGSLQYAANFDDIDQLAAVYGSREDVDENKAERSLLNAAMSTLDTQRQADVPHEAAASSSTNGSNGTSSNETSPIGTAGALDAAMESLKLKLASPKALSYSEELRRLDEFRQISDELLNRSLAGTRPGYASNGLSDAKRAIAFTKGVFYGFFVDGLWGTVEGIGTIAKTLWENSPSGIAFNDIWAILADKPQELTAIKQAAQRERLRQQLDTAEPYVRAISIDMWIISAQPEKFFDMLMGDSQATAELLTGLQPETKTLLLIVGDKVSKMLDEIKEKIGNISEEEWWNIAGRITGAILYEVVEGYATAGAAKAGLAAKIAKGLQKLPGGKVADEIVQIVAKTVDDIGSMLTVLQKYCFVAGTPIRTPDGDQPIGSLKQGDRVLSRPEGNADAPVRVQVVEEIFKLVAPIVELHVGGQMIETTAEHPFYVIGHGWRPTSELQPGDLLLGDGNHVSKVDRVIFTGQLQPVYNMRVSEDHTYFVGAVSWGFSVWAHNRCYETTVSPKGAVQVWENIGGKRILVDSPTTLAEFEKWAHKAANEGKLNLEDLRKSLVGSGLKDVSLRLSANELPLLKRGTPDWDKAVKELRESNRRSLNFRVASLQDAMALLHEAKGKRGFGNAMKAGTKEKAYKRGLQQHGIEVGGEAPWHTLPHLKFKDELHGLDQAGHIFFGP